MLLQQPVGQVKAVIDGYPEWVQSPVLRIRQWIFEIAGSDPMIGKIEETLKWGEPSYLTSQTKSGSTIRLAWRAKHPEEFGIFLNCQTTLIDEARSLFPTRLRFEGNRGILFMKNDALPEDEIKLCLDMALTYHKRKVASAR